MTRIMRLASVLVCAALGACALNVDREPPRGELANVTLDKTFGRYSEALEPQLILITVSPEQHAELRAGSGNPASSGLPAGYQSFLDNINQRFGLQRVADWPLDSIDIYCIVFENTGPLQRDEIIAGLLLEPQVESAQPVNTFDVQQRPYDDPYLSLQHGFRSLKAERSHRWSQGRGVRVAVIDTGLDSSHPELMSRTVLMRNFVDRDASQFKADVHGTAVAGVIAASAGNGEGMAGVAPQASLLALKACWQVSHGGERAVCNSLTLAKALNVAIGENADVINLSLAGPPDALLERLVNKALSDNIVVVGARPAHGRPAFPTATPGTIAVSMPGYGAESVIAPGQKVLSTRPDNQYDFFTGSSFSSAHIAGLAALVRELSPGLSPQELLALLNETADPASGAVDACKAIAALAGAGGDGCDR